MRTTLTFLQILVTLVFASFFAAEAQIPTNGLRLHLKADAGTSTSTPGGKISQWNDQSGNGFHATETRNVNWQPTYVTDSGFPAVRFSPAGPTSMLLPDHATLGLVNSENEIFLVARTSSAAVQFPFAGGINYTELHFNGASGMRYLPTFGVAVDNPADVDNGAFHVINASATTTNAQLGVDGVFVSQNVNATHTINTGFNLGTRGDGGFRFDGDIAEIIVYNRKLTTAESMQVAEYLKNKYSTPFTAYGAPQTPASGPNFTGVTQTSMNVNLTKGSGTHRVVVARKGGAVTQGPSNGVAYTGSSSFGAGSHLGDGNFVVYAGTEGTSVVVSNLEFNGTYHVAAYEYYLVGGVPQYGSSITNSQFIPNLTTSGPIQFSTITQNSLTMSFTPGTGTHRLILAKAASVVDHGPADGVAYTGNTVMGTGDQLGSGNFVLYSGTAGSELSITNLDFNMPYGFMIFEYTFVNGVPKYHNLATSASATTLNLTPTSGITFDSMTRNSMILNFTKGSGSHRLIIARAHGGVNANPVNGTSYTANAQYALGAQIGFGNYVVYNGSEETSVNLSRMVFFARYYFTVIEYTIVNGLPKYTTLNTTASQVTSDITPSSNVLLSNPTTSSLQVSLTKGEGTNRIIIARQGSPVNFDPQNGGLYGTHGNGVFGAGVDIGANHGFIGNYIVYNGTEGENVTITGLQSGTEYFIAVYEFGYTAEGWRYSIPGKQQFSEFTQPSPSSNFNFSTVRIDSLILDFTVGTGQKRLVIAKKDQAVDASPVNGTSYPANATFGSGTELGTGNFVVFNGTGNSVTISGLENSSNYHFTVVEYSEKETVPRYQTINVPSFSQSTAAPEPTIASTSPILLQKQLNSIQFSFTKGNGNQRLVLAKANTAVDVFPVDNSNYSANATFGSGSEIGTDNFVVYSGSDSVFTVSGLSTNTLYHFAVLEFNGELKKNYSSSANLTFSAKTLNQIPGTVASSSLKFNGSDEVVTIPHDAAFHTDAITMEMWFKPQNVGAVPFLIAKATEEMEIHLSNSTQSIRFIPTLGVYLDSPNSTFEFNQWNHIAVSYKPSESLAKMWINGIEVALTNNGTNPLSQPLQHSSLAVLLGQRNGFNLPFTGEIDEVRIWNDVRTNQEIREHMFSSIPSDFANLVTYHQFNEGTGSTTLDASSGLNGTLSNFEFDANNGWINSGIPFGTGTVSASDAISSGTINASGLDITLTENFDNASIVLSKRFTVAPLVESSGNTLNLNNPYWVVETSTGAGNYEASLTFNVPSSFLSVGSRIPNQVKLYTRPFGSDGTWTLLKSSASSITSNTITFDGITQMGQFTVGRDVIYDFQANAGKSILLDGINDYVQIPFNAAMNTQKLTMEFWLKWNRSGTAVDFVVSRGGEEWEVHLGSGSNGIRFIPRGAVFIDSQVEAFTPGQWNHLAFVYDPSQSLGKIYVNGVDVTGAVSGNLASPLVNTNFGINLGRRQSNEILHFSGELDEFRVWNSARTQQQIQENMNRTLPDGYYSDLVMYFQFNEGTGTSTSEIQNGFAGTHTNFDYNQSSGWVSSLTPITQELGISTTLTGTAGWRLLSNPVTNTSFASVLSPLWSQGATGADNEGGGVNVFTWATTSSDNNAASWTPISSFNETFTPGKGILMYVYSDDNGPNVEGNSGFPKSLQINGVTNGQDVNLSAQLNPNAGGWSLLGNPFAVNIDWDLVTKTGLNNSVYVWDHNGSAWKYWNTGVGTLPNGVVGTMNAFFVETEQLNPTLTIPAAAQVSGQVAFLGKEATQSKPTFISLHLQLGDESNAVIIHLNENARLERDALDALWLRALNPSDLAFAALTEAGEQLSIFSAPTQASILEIPLYVNVSGDRNGRLNMDSLAYESGYFARIWDSQTGTFYLPGETVSIEPANENFHSSLDNLMESETSNGDEEKGSRSVSDKLPRMNTQSNIGQRYILQLSKEPFEVAFPELPSEITLQQNFPNPFNPSTTFRFGLPQKADVSITVMDILGRVVAQPVRGSKTAGWHTYSWDASQLSSGVYFYYLQVNGKLSKTMKMTLVK